ncbi:hypothetical protein GCM10027275_29430 [Rhabdobacter roseus]|uniref:Uncharacterized protein n=1 Tax=Rhabdobacter roseus TaxID=1655419 RepID=A0A840TXH1_9BACT|nr:hypothetical protein [Rhabdobacter roseus]MBB5284898.1 hypothetical protein [Rhabdobacter roseus]
MNIAFGALLIFLLLFPGIIFRIAYLEGPYSRRIIQSSLVDELILSLVPAFIIQFAGYLLIENVPLFRYGVDERMFYYLLTGHSNIDFTQIEQSVFRFFMYQLTAFLIAFSLGKLLRVVVLRKGLDVRYRSLSVFNDWYYLLRGKLKMDTQEQLPIMAVYVDALVETKEGSYLYCGLINDFFLSKDNGLDRLYFREVYRRRLDKDYEKESSDETTGAKWLDARYYEMPGEIFVIPYAQIKNLNVRYLYLVEGTPASDLEDEGIFMEA